jgi:hypothetical protein
MSETNLNEDNASESRRALAGPVERCVISLRRYNEWRRGADFEQPEPKEIGTDIDFAADIIERMRKAIKATIDENMHLADGDDCTLKHLVELEKSL